MTDELNNLITCVRAVADIGKQISEYTITEKINLYHNLAYRRINNIYYNEATDINNSLVRILELSNCIRQPYFRLITKEKDVTWPLMLQSIERYTDAWELALEKHRYNEEVQKLLFRYSQLPEELNRMLCYMK